jgi:hypothetical protein
MMKQASLILSAVILLLASCNKEPGVGGLASISGKVYVYDVNGTFTDTLSEYYAMDERVYIIYGTDDSTYDDDFRTSLDGSFEFGYLTPGDYTVFAYSDCITCPSGFAPVTKTVTITDNKEQLYIGEINILK